MSQKFVIGIDGGGTYCRAMLQDTHGNILSVGEAGPANIMSDAKQALASLTKACNKAIEAAPVDVKLDDVVVAAGLAGANIPQAKSAFLSLPMPFKQIEIISDLHAACLGAHGGKNGALLICGTGSAGTLYQSGQFTDKGGYGFNVGDNASAAWLGHAAIKHTLLAFDNIEKRGVLFSRILAHFATAQPQALIQKIAYFNAQSYGTLAPLVVECFSEGCQTAKALLNAGGEYLSKLGKALLSETDTPLPVCFVGGLAKVYVPFMDKQLTRAFVDAQSDARQGAIDYVKQQALI